MIQKSLLQNAVTSLISVWRIGMMVTIFISLATISFSQEFEFQREISGYEKGYIQFDGYKYIDVDSEGNLLVSDSDYNLVYLIDKTGKLLNRISYTTAYNDIGAHVTFDNASHIYISSWYFKKIYIYDFSGNILNTITRGNDWFGDLDTDAQNNLYVISNEGIVVYNEKHVFQFVIGEYGTGNNQLNQPSSIAVHGDSVFVSDVNRVHVYSTNGTYLSHFDFQGNANGAGDIAIHPDGSIYVDNSSYDRIDIFSQEGILTSQINFTVGMNDGEIYSGSHSMTLDATGNVYQADPNHKIQIFSSSGTYIKKIGLRASANMNILHFPSSMDFDSTGNIYLINGEYPTIKQIDRDGNTISSSGENLFNQGTLIDPWQPNLCVTKSNKIVAVDYEPNVGARVRMLDTKGNLITKIDNPDNPSTGGFADQTYVETDTADNIYVYDGRWVYIFDKDVKFLQSFRVSQTPADPPIEPDTRDLMFTSGLTIDENKNIFIIDPQANLVYMYSYEGVLKKQISVSLPYSVATDLSRKLIYVSTEFNGIQVFNYEGDYIAMINEPQAGESKILLPVDIAVDPMTHNVFVVDFRNQSIHELKFNYTVDVINAVDDELKSIAVFPNPVHSFLTIKSKTAVEQIEVYNELGMQSDVSWDKDGIYLSKLSPGFYIVRIHTTSTVSNFKITKQ